jgi:hypothetical protein
VSGLVTFKNSEAGLETSFTGLKNKPATELNKSVRESSKPAAKQRINDNNLMF